MQDRKERGAIVAEATIALTAYVFLIFTILSVVNICYIQAKIATSLDYAAKELSQYSYLYFKFSINQYEEQLHAETGESRELANNTVKGVGELMTAFSGAAGAVDSGDFDALYQSIEAGVGVTDSLITQYGDAIADDPKAFIIGMGKLAGEEALQKGKTLLTQVMAKAMMKKNLVVSDTDNADSFLKRYKVVNGLDGLDFNKTTFLPYGSNDIFLVVTYDVQVIRFLNIDYKFTIRQCAKTKAWGNGISKITPENNITAKASIWNAGPAVRGQQIVEAEKKKLPYTVKESGIHGYDDAGGKNEFIQIVSIDTTLPSYQDATKIRYKLNEQFSDLYSNVAKAGDSIEVTDAAGTTKTIDVSGKEKTYQLILVVPDNADMDTIQAAINKFKADKASVGYQVEVTVKTGYGSVDTDKAQTETEE